LARFLIQNCTAGSDLQRLEHPTTRQLIPLFPPAAREVKSRQ
jgi:hypothetical protein